MRTTRTRSFSSSTLWCFESVSKGSHLCFGRGIGEGMALLSSSHKSVSENGRYRSLSLFRSQRPDSIKIEGPFGAPACHAFWNRWTELLIETECVFRKLLRSEAICDVAHRRNIAR